jgi:hypothetical protein
MDRRVSFVTVLIVLITTWISIALPGRAEEVTVPNSFVTGESYMRMDQSGRSAYVAGLLDGLMVSTLFGAAQDRIKILQVCNVGRKNSQLAEVLYIYIKERPEYWHWGAHILFHNRMLELCPQARPTSVGTTP